MYLFTYAALVPAPLVWVGDAAGTVVMLSGLAGALLPVALLLRARRRRRARPAPLLERVKVDSPARRAAA